MTGATTTEPIADLVLVAPTAMEVAGLTDELRSDPAVRVEVIRRSSGSSHVERQALAQAVNRPSVTGVVHLVQAEGGDSRQPLATLSEDDWIRLAEDPTWTLIETLQAVEGRDHASAAVIVVVETTGMAGEVGGTAAAATSEAARAAAKSAARAWGGAGPAVQIIATDASVLTGMRRTAPSSRAPNRPEPTMVDLAKTIRAALYLPSSVGLATLVVDGGRTMLP